LSSLADLKWKSGDRAGAVTLYRRILDQVGESSHYGQIAAQKLHESGDPASAKAAGAGDTDKTPTSPSRLDTSQSAGKSR